jgi:zinc/manganese transport system substrate-binding protein
MKLIIGILLIGLPAFGVEPIRVVTTTTDLAWAAKKIGGARVEVESLLEGNENPHYVDALPSFIQKVASAQVVCVVGLDLEVGWMPKVLSRSGNAQVQPGGTGYCDTGKNVSVLEKPTGPVNRSMGDVHPDGNPHFTLSPIALGDAASVIAETLGNVDPLHRKEYQLALKALETELSQLRQQLRTQIQNALGKNEANWMEYHREFAYYFSAYGLKSTGSLEEKPGVPPSAGRIGEMALSAKKAGVTALFATEYNPHKALDRFTELSGIPVLRLQIFPRKGSGSDYIAVQKKIADSISNLLAKRTLTP